LPPLFGGHAEKEPAEVLQVSWKTAMRDWPPVKTWLQREMTGDGRR